MVRKRASMRIRSRAVQGRERIHGQTGRRSDRRPAMKAQKRKMLKAPPKHMALKFNDGEKELF